nr:hypothetical protein [Tanacetum cinerariifolium]
MDKMLGDQKWRNVEVYLGKIVVKRKTKENLIKDVEETLDKLQRVNVKIDPSKCTFGMKEGNFLGYVITTEGIKADPEKVKVILRGPTPKGLDEIRSLSLQLTNISRFIPKMAELMLPIRNVQKNLDTAETSGWKIEATEAFQKIKRRLAKLPTLVVQLEGEERYNAGIKATKILLQGLPKYIYTLINHYTDAKDIWDNVKMLLEGEVDVIEGHEAGQILDEEKLAFLGRLNRGQGNNLRGGGAAGYGGAHNRVGNANLAQENGVALDEEQLLFLAGGQDNAIDEDVNEQHVQDLALNVDNVFQADECDAFDSDVDEAPVAQTMFMVNLSSANLVSDEAGPSYDSDILSEYVKDNVVPGVQIVDKSLTAKLATYKEQVELYERRARPKSYYSELNKVVVGYKNPLCLTRAKQVQPALYNGHEIIKDNHVPAIVHNTKDILEIAEITMRKMNDKMKDPEYVNHKVKIAPHDYSKENFLATFTPQKQLTLEQIFWSQCEGNVITQSHKRDE